LAPIRVLLADDHANFRAIVMHVLQSEVEVVKTVGDGQAVFDEATRLDPDLLILDITMPILNGIEAVRKLRAAGFKGKIIFLTVHPDPDYVRAAHAAGAQGYVVKSRLASDLLLALREVLAGKLFVSPNLIHANSDSDR
jgi:DNA-binding NarL/FixJ family response regulator